jgi:lipopolysaccharide export system permease protein
VIDGGGKKPLVVRIKHFEREIETLFAPPPFRPRGQDERELTLAELWFWQGEPPRRSSAAEMAAELHSRIVRIVSILFLPFLAIALGATSPKRRQGMNLAIGLFLLITYNEVLQFGKRMIRDASVSPWIGQELPMLLFILLSCWMFVRAARQSSNAGLDPLTALYDRVAAIVGRLLPRAARP